MQEKQKLGTMQQRTLSQPGAQKAQVKLTSGGRDHERGKDKFTPHVDSPTATLAIHAGGDPVGDWRAVLDMALQYMNNYIGADSDPEHRLQLYGVSLSSGR